MAVRVAGVLTGGGAVRVELALLNEQYERPARVLAAPHCRFGGRDLFQWTAEVNRRCLETRRISPRNRAVERPVDLEHAGAESKPAQAPHVSTRKMVGAEPGELVRSGVEQHDLGFGKVRQRGDGGAGADHAAKVLQMSGEGAGDGVGSTGGDRPRLDVAGDGEDEPEGGGEVKLEGQDGVRGAAGEQGPGPRPAEVASGEPRRGAERLEPESGEQERVLR